MKLLSEKRTPSLRINMVSQISPDLKKSQTNEPCSHDTLLRIQWPGGKWVCTVSPTTSSNTEKASFVILNIQKATTLLKKVNKLPSRIPEEPSMGQQPSSQKNPGSDSLFLEVKNPLNNTPERKLTNAPEHARDCHNYLRHRYKAHTPV